jgi:membrane peptidoglycan carboxypeptidase
VKVSGELNYHFLLDVDLNHPNNLILESSLLKFHFAIHNYGELTKMNAPFLYTAYEKDRPVQTFEVGAGNPSFRALDAISPLLRAAVLQSEDGQFFFHKGFRLDAMREALIQDIKLKRFARGGSTISMQLVKNVFLNRHKNIARKLEEALLVWLIEENRITTKERMFEVYLNVAEWGPMIYGIGEASRFYFDKEPSELTLNEAIFLASIIPSPKRFANSFDHAGQLKEREFWYFNRIAERLCKKGSITEQQKAEFVPVVVLSGIASQQLTIVKDSAGVVLPVVGL